MKIAMTQRPWFLPLVGAAALLVQAWLTSPFEMVVFGLPLFVVAVGGQRLARALPAGGAQPSTAHLGPATKSIVSAVVVLLVVLLIAGFAYIVWGRIQNSGLVGWLDAVQAQRGGKYSARMSFITATLYLLIAFALGIALLWRFGRPSRTADSPRS